MLSIDSTNNCAKSDNTFNTEVIRDVTAQTERIDRKIVSRALCYNHNITNCECNIKDNTISRPNSQILSDTKSNAFIHANSIRL